MADRCYCVFEGGGAKGIAHVGALRALEASGLQLVGFAGTSAGAIVAALAAAGYTSTDMFGSTGSILDELDSDETNPDPGRVKFPIRSPQRLLGPAWPAMKLARRSAYILLALLAAAILLPWLSSLPEVSNSIITSAVMIVLVAAVLLWALEVSTGFASVESVRNAINQALSLKTRGTRSTDPVTFRQLEQNGGRPLRIVASNISTGQLVLFSAERTPDVAVADAVAASICIPVVFSPWIVGNDLHFDGGLVSNLPAWTFDAERAIDRDAWTAAIEVADTRHKRPKGYGILKAAALTALFGSNYLNTRSVERLKSVSLEVKLGLLEFNFDRPRAKEIIAYAEAQCALTLVTQMVDVPALMTDICQSIETAARRLINDARSQAGLEPYHGPLRVGMWRPARDDLSSFLNEFSWGFQRHTDERLRLPRSRSLLGDSLRQNTAYYADGTQWTRRLSRVEDRWPRKMIWKGMNWIYCVPYAAEDPEREMVITVDGQEEWEIDAQATDATLDSLLDEILTILNHSLPEELVHHAEDQENEAADHSARVG